MKAQLPPDSVNTYAAPASKFPLTSLSGAPTTAVLPETATDSPKLKPSVPFGAVNLA